MHNSNSIVIITIEKRHISHARATKQDHLRDKCGTGVQSFMLNQQITYIYQ